MPEDEETEQETVEHEAEESESGYKGYKCVKCEQEVEINPVEEKIICPKCSHRVLLKMRSDNPKKVEAV
jgi:DNA-directed RNA polymerase subunit RPC12/RpoP